MPTATVIGRRSPYGALEALNAPIYAPVPPPWPRRAYGVPGAFVGPQGAVPQVRDVGAFNGAGVGQIAVTRVGRPGYGNVYGASYVAVNYLSNGQIVSDDQLGVTGASGSKIADFFRYGTSDDARIRAIQRRKALARMEAEIRKNLRVSGRQTRMTARTESRIDRRAVRTQAAADVRVARAQSGAPTVWDSALDAAAGGAAAIVDAAGGVLGINQDGMVMAPEEDVVVPPDEQVTEPPPINWYPYIFGGSALLAVIVVGATMSSKKKKGT